jgi:hypothetical protein
MKIQGGPFWFDFPHDLVDDALMEASRSAPETLRKQFLEERDAVSTIEIVDIREEHFRQLDARWAERLGIGEPLLGALRERGAKADRISGCVVQRVRAGAEEGAMLQPAEDGGRDVLCLAVRVDTVLSRDRLSNLLAGVV